MPVNSQFPEQTPMEGGHLVGDLAQLDDVGTWDGVTPSRTITAYEDGTQSTIFFGGVSFFHTPWRSYMDVHPAEVYLNSLASAVNGPNRDESPAAIKVAGKAGIRHMRYEVSWHGFEYDDDTVMKSNVLQEFNILINSMKEAGIRPLILLNCNDGLPTPYKDLPVTFTQPANVGDMEVYVNPSAVPNIVLRHTGFQGMIQGNHGWHAMYPAITQTDATTGRLTLSAPMPQAFAAGDATNLIILKYAPIGATAPGTPAEIIADTQNSLNGFVKRCKTLYDYLFPIVGTPTDAGFDFEVFNEYTFGSNWFSGLDYYYSPPLALPSPRIVRDGVGFDGGSACEVLYPMICDEVKNNPIFRNVKVISGFSNQRPDDNAKWLYKNGHGFSRHYYTGYAQGSYYLPDNQWHNSHEIAGSGTLTYERRWFNALGDREGSWGLDDKTDVSSIYVPPHVTCMPEWRYHYYETESMTRDTVPFQDIWSDHGRYGNDKTGREAELWQTEVNLFRLNHMKEIAQKAEDDFNDIKNTPAFRALDDWFNAKIVLRQYSFLAHKGQKRAYLYRLKDDNPAFGSIPLDFYEALAANNYVLTPEIEDKMGTAFKALGRITTIMKTGVQIDNPRKIKVTEIVEYQPRYVWKGLGTPEHPHRYHGDDFAFFPWQLDSNKFCIHYYVITRDIRHSWDQDLHYYDISRYTMPEQEFDIKITNVNGIGATVTALDPVTNLTVTATIINTTTTSITVKVKSVDYPRMLTITESTVKPLIKSAKVERTALGGLFTFTPNVSGTVKVEWGAYPLRQKSYFTQNYYTSTNFSGAPTVTTVEYIDFLQLLPGVSGGWEWIGQITPLYSETYRFIAEADAETSLTIDGVSVFTSPNFGRMTLVAGQTYSIRLRYWTQYGAGNGQPHHTAMLKWASPSQTFELVRGNVTKNEIVESVTANTQKVIHIEGMRVMDGVRATLTAGNIDAVYPIWPSDVKGVIYSTTAVVPVPDAEEPRPTPTTIIKKLGAASIAEGAVIESKIGLTDVVTGTKYKLEITNGTLHLVSASLGPASPIKKISTKAIHDDSIIGNKIQLTDTVTGTKHKIVVTNGVLQISAADAISPSTIKRIATYSLMDGSVTESKISLVDTATTTKYRLEVSDGVLGIKPQP